MAHKKMHHYTLKCHCSPLSIPLNACFVLRHRSFLLLLSDRDNILGKLAEQLKLSASQACIFPRVSACMTSYVRDIARPTLDTRRQVSKQNCTHFAWAHPVAVQGYTILYIVMVAGSQCTPPPAHAQVTAGSKNLAKGLTLITSHSLLLLLKVQGKCQAGCEAGLQLTPTHPTSCLHPAPQAPMHPATTACLPTHSAALVCSWPDLGCPDP